MEQRCYLWSIWLTWVGLPLLAIAIGLRIGWPAGLFVFAVGIVSQVLYVRWFPSISHWVGYGSVSDIPAPAVGALAQPSRVILYTANVCPFCPIVRRRLADLQQRMGFELQEIDVTFRPEIIRAKGLRSVPVVEANGHLLVGNATSEQLAALLQGRPEPPGSHAMEPRVRT
jgi:glutaredoxin